MASAHVPHRPKFLRHGVHAPDAYDGALGSSSSHVNHPSAPDAATGERLPASPPNRRHYRVPAAVERHGLQDHERIYERALRKPFGAQLSQVSRC